MAMIRRDPVGRTDQPDNKTIYEFLVDSTGDLTGLDYAGVGSMAYVRSEPEGSRIYVRTATGWEAV